MNNKRDYNNELDEPARIARWHIAHIEEGLRQVEAGEFASDSEVAEVFSRWRAVSSSEVC